jgi:hypothetical protein
VNIAAQLKQLETAFALPPEAAPAVPGLNAEDNDTLKKVFSLAPAAFVDAWARALTLGDSEFTQQDRDIFAHAIEAGTSRLKVIDAMYARKWAGPSPLQIKPAVGTGQIHGQFVVVENLQNFAPDDQAAFVRFAFSQICGRDPTSSELLTFDFDLRRGALDRRMTIKKIVRIANREGRPALWDSLDLEEDHGDPTCARTLPTGFAYDEQGRQSLVFIREMPGAGWIVAPDILRQSPLMERRGWLVHPGWIFTGPKRSLRSGVWRVDLDILQEDGHVLDVDLVANSGLDVLQTLSICGPFSGNVCVTLSDHHRFVELRLLARENSAPVWINPRNISMHRIS